MLHRDLKPSNIMLGAFGEAVVVDWGLAKWIDTAAPVVEDAEYPRGPSHQIETLVSGPGMASGTPAYMSPEQADGDLGALGPASDVYSLGATLYAILSGKAPFDGESIHSVLRKVKEGRFPPPRVVNPSVPRGLEAVCLKAMALQPRNRYPSARALADDVEAWMADEPMSALHESWVTRSARWARRHRAWVGSAVVSLLMVSLISLAAVLKIDDSLLKERAAVMRSDDALRKERIAHHAALLSSARGDLEHGLNLCHTGEVAKGMLWMARGLEMTPHDEQGAALGDAIRRNLGSQSQQLRFLEAFFGQPATDTGDAFSNCTVYSPDGRTFLSAWSDRKARLYNANNGMPIGQPLMQAEMVYGAAFSPNGRTALTGSSSEARFWDTATGQRQGDPIRHPSAVVAAAFTTDGTSLITAGADHVVRVWEVETGKLQTAPISGRTSGCRPQCSVAMQRRSSRLTRTVQRGTGTWPRASRSVSRSSMCSRSRPSALAQTERRLPPGT